MIRGETKPMIIVTRARQSLTATTATMTGAARAMSLSRVWTIANSSLLYLRQVVDIGESFVEIAVLHRELVDHGLQRIRRWLGWGRLDRRRDHDRDRRRQWDGCAQVAEIPPGVGRVERV